MLLFMEWKLFLKIASSFVPQLSAHRTTLRARIPFKWSLSTSQRWSEVHAPSQARRKVHYFPHRDCCVWWSTAPRSLSSACTCGRPCPAPKKRKTNAVNNCPLRLMELKSGLARLLWRTGGLKRLSDSTSQCERSPILLCMGNLEMVSV